MPKKTRKEKAFALAAKFRRQQKKRDKKFPLDSALSSRSGGGRNLRNYADLVEFLETDKYRKELFKDAPRTNPNTKTEITQNVTDVVPHMKVTKRWVEKQLSKLKNAKAKAARKALAKKSKDTTPQKGRAPKE